VHIELIDLLRCPRDHEETWLVAAFTKVDDRYVEEARLGCPVCNEAYVIHRGVAGFGAMANPVTSEAENAPDPDAAIRLAAFLNLVKPGSLAVLQGRHAVSSHQVSEITQCRLIAIDPDIRIRDTELVATVRSDRRIPLASNSADGVALSDSRYLDDAMRILRQGGRLVLPPDTSLPAGATEVARDDRVVIAEAVGPVISLRRS
jgi:uncharacterized protein YbaR (Trm112 family)